MHQCQQIDNAENDDEFKVIFGIDEASELLLATGFRKPISQLCLSYRTFVTSALVDYHCMLKVSFMFFSFLPPHRVCQKPYRFTVLPKYIFNIGKGRNGPFYRRAKSSGCIKHGEETPSSFHPDVYRL